MPSPVANATDLERLAAGRALVGYFGYGSLVNRQTLANGAVAAFPARLKGWRRTWRPRPDMGPGMGPTAGVHVSGGLAPSLLTAHPEPGAAIDGLLVIDLADNLSEVDAREFRYHRRDIGIADLEFHGEADIAVLSEIRLHVYEARTEHPPTEGRSPILQSYLDAVLQGFLNEFGPEGVHRFIAETEAFHMPIHEDRHAPLYPRAVALSDEEIALFEAALARRPAKASG